MWSPKRGVNPAQKLGNCPGFGAQALTIAGFVPRRAGPAASGPGLGPTCWPPERAPAGASATSKGEDVKLIMATIKPFKLEEVREALTKVGVRGMMVTEIKGFGAQSGHTEIYRGAEYAVNFVPKVKLEIVVPDAMADEVTETIARAARTGKIGDGKIFVLDVENALRVRTGETGDDAI